MLADGRGRRFPVCSVSSCLSLEVSGAGIYLLPTRAIFDIMTSAPLRRRGADCSELEGTRMSDIYLSGVYPFATGCMHIQFTRWT